MSKKKAPEGTPPPEPLPPGNLRARSWKRFLRGPDQELLDELYVPALSEAISYDRCCAYFSSTVLSAAARGFGRLIERLQAMGDKAPRPAVRLVVNEEMSQEDVRALVETGDTTKLEQALQKRLKTPKYLLEKQRLAMLGWLAKDGLLQVRVGVMRHGTGIVHAKYGVVTDESGNAVIFAGSGNESAKGIASNYERLEVSTSWDDPERHEEYAEEFEALWDDTHPDVHTVPLPEALRLKLIKFAPKDPPLSEPTNALARQKAAMIWNFVVEAPYLPNGETACDATAMVDMWPHQRRVVEEVSAAWPSGRLLCDEVGMGKTIEALLVLRRLMAGRGVRRALILVPAGLTGQWQAELREKGGLVFPRLEGTDTLVWPDGRKEKTEGLAEVLKQDMLIMSRETARTEGNCAVLLSASPWDLLMLDEAHAARRKSQVEGEFNAGTLLLDLLRQLQLRGKARGIILLSATPMQTHPWEPWDLLSVLGEGGPWLAEFSCVRDYYEALKGLEKGLPTLETARRAAAVIGADSDFPRPLPGDADAGSTEDIARAMVFAKQSERKQLAQQLRQGSPLARRMHRNGRNALREYFQLGLLECPPPKREVEDVRFDYQDPAERAMYRSVTAYIEKRYDELEREKRGKGFVMTVYRRRASSSPLAIERSLDRRRRGLLSVIDDRAYDEELFYGDAPERMDLDDLPEDEGAGKVSAAFPSEPQVARRELEEVEVLLRQARALLQGRDTKLDEFYTVLGGLTNDGRPALVFTQYTDTLEYLRDRLVAHYGQRIGCYTGSGGQRWDGNAWQSITKDAIAQDLQNGELEVLLCTDAASEGLNLQAAGAVINYDLPWNPSKVEQRIGRIDRIGQQCPDVRVVNLFLMDSVDDKVYGALRRRCGLFERFLGPMQPVLARARQMLDGRAPVDVQALTSAADEVDRDPLATEIYLEAPAVSPERDDVVMDRNDLETALGYLSSELDFRVKSNSQSTMYTVSGKQTGRTVFAGSPAALEDTPKSCPLSALEPALREIRHSLSRPGEHLPLVIGTFEKGPFRAANAYWLGSNRNKQVRTMGQLARLVESWDGTYPDPSRWVKAAARAKVDARKSVKQMERRAYERERDGLENQLDAARRRLQRELGRYLVCLGATTAELNEHLHRQLARTDLSGVARLKEAFDRLGGFPEWPAELERELAEFVDNLTENRRRARLAGSELDAALQDPRWTARRASGTRQFAAGGT